MPHPSCTPSVKPPTLLRLLLLLLWALLGAGAVHAQEATPAGSGLRFSGFGTLGVVQADSEAGRTFRREIDVPAQRTDRPQTGLDSRLGLQANWQPALHWDVVGQVVFKRRASEARLSQAVEWAFVAFRPTPGLTLRLGRTSPDIFLLADYRNVGFAYPWVRPSSEFYGWMPMFFSDGADLRWQWQTAADATWQVRMAATQVDLTIPGAPKPAKVKVRDFYMASLSREHEGLLVKLSLSQLRLQLMSPDLQSLAQLFDGLSTFPVPSVASSAATLRQTLPLDEIVARYLSLGARWDAGPWLVHAEAARVYSRPASQSEVHAYASVARRWQALTGFVMAGRARTLSPVSGLPDWQAALTPIVGVDAARLLQAGGTLATVNGNAQRYDQHTVSTGVRWDVHAQAAFKLQWDRVHVNANGSGLWINNGRTDRDRANVFSAVVDVVF